MKCTEPRLTEEYHIKDNLYGYVRIYRTSDKVQVDLSLYENIAKAMQPHRFFVILFIKNRLDKINNHIKESFNIIENVNCY